MTSASITISGTTHNYVYTYNDNGIRVSLKVDSANPTRYLIDRSQAFDQVLEEYAPSGVLAATYIRGIDLLFQDRNPGQSYYLKDGLGSTRALAGSTANVTDTYTYDAYGSMTASTGSTANSFLFAGQQFDSGIGQYYMRAGYYSSAAGRFAIRDTLQGSASKPLSFNDYMYTDDDPVWSTDPSGRDPDLVSTPSAAANTVTIAGLQAPADFHALSTVAALRSQAVYYSYWLMLNWQTVLFYAEFTFTGALFGLQVTTEVLDRVDRGLTALVNNADPVPENTHGEVGDFMQRKFGANATYLRGVDDTVQEADGKTGVISLRVRSIGPGVSDELAIQRLLGTLRKMASDISTDRGFEVREGVVGETLKPEQVGSRAALLGIEESRTNLLVNPSFINGVRAITAQFRTVAVGAVPIRGWRSR